MCGAIPLAMMASGSSLGKAAPYALGLLPGLAINAMGGKNKGIPKQTFGDGTTVNGAMS